MMNSRGFINQNDASSQIFSGILWNITRRMYLNNKYDMNQYVSGNCARYVQIYVPFEHVKADSIMSINKNEQNTISQLTTTFSYNEG